MSIKQATTEQLKASHKRVMKQIQMRVCDVRCYVPRDMADERAAIEDELYARCESFDGVEDYVQALEY